MVLVPAVMQLVGSANWWLPRWIAWATPNLAIEPDVDHLGPGPHPAGQRRGRRVIPATPAAAGVAAAVRDPESAIGAIKVPDSVNTSACAWLSGRR